jgi:hypothetical protein
VDAVRDLGGAGVPVIVVGTDAVVLAVVTT